MRDDCIPLFIEVVKKINADSGVSRDIRDYAISCLVYYVCNLCALKPSELDCLMKGGIA